MGRAARITVTFHAINIYHDTSHCSLLDNILNLKTNSEIPMIITRDFNTHSHFWLLSSIWSSSWSDDLEEWAFS
jgi:hypothetical protein